MRRRWIGVTLFTYSGALEVFAFWKKLLTASRLATSVSLIILLYHPVEEKTGSAVERERVLLTQRLLEVSYCQDLP